GGVWNCSSSTAKVTFSAGRSEQERIAVSGTSRKISFRYNLSIVSHDQFTMHQVYVLPPRLPSCPILPHSRPAGAPAPCPERGLRSFPVLPYGSLQVPGRK